ncbi:MAG: right-handed parallel beta-helix repeat-containing protein, partial [Desulfobacteraceae bacterium]
MKSVLLQKRLFLFALTTLLLALVPLPASADTTVGGTISTDTTWAAADSPFIVTSNVTVQGADGADGITTLTIEPGVVVKLNNSRYITIGASSGNPGALSAVGTEADPITFTSNQATPAPGDWNYIRFYNTADDATTVMEHCVVEYGGYSYGSLYVYQASPTFRNVTVQNSKTRGAYLYTTEPTIEDCTFSGNQDYDLYYTGTVGGTVTGTTINSGICLLASGTVSFSGNTINQNNALPIKAYADNVGEISASTFTNVDTASYLEVAGQTVSRDATWTAAIPYAITNNTTVKGTDGADGITTLTLEPGAVVKLNSSRIIDIGASSGDPGALSAVGTAA